MPIPEFDERGLLPPGVCDCTLAEIANRFCLNDHRRMLWASFEHFLNAEYRPRGLPPVLWIDGSFSTDKALPSDIDVVTDLYGAPEGVVGMALGLHLESSRLKASYRVDFWPRHPLIPNDLTQFFQYVGDKRAAQLRIDPHDHKGILRVRL